MLKVNFWQELQKPILILAPMDGVTDTVFRQIIISTGRPDVFYTEFVPVDALVSKGAAKVLKILQYSKQERPIVAQIWGTDPQKFYQAAKLLYKLKFDGIDINMGCPDRSVVKKGAGAALIKNPQLAKEIICATVDGALDLPVSVKTRIGFDKLDTENWVFNLLDTPISALVLHLRTAAEMSKAPAHWDEVVKAVKIRDECKSKALIIGNGDIKNLKEAQNKHKKYQIDGVMVGRAALEDVYFFNENINKAKILSKQKINILLKHLRLFQKTYQDQKPFDLMKKFVKCYVNNFPGASEHRVKLMETKNLNQLINSAKELTLL